jgi:hypothetical protein
VNTADRKKYNAVVSERDALAEKLNGAIEWVVLTCMQSRGFEPSKQAAFLRDCLITQFDPHLIVTQRLREQIERPRAASRGEE